jgi:glucokinase
MNLGIEIGGTKLQLVTGDASGLIIKRFRFSVDAGAGAAGILANIESVLNELTKSPTAVGVGFGGPVDWQTGRLAASHQIGGWAGFDLGGWLRDRLPDAQIAIDNDANVAALAEARLGVARGRSRVLYVTLGSGMGAGLVTDGQLYHGASPGELELGHLWLVPPDGANFSGQTLEQTCSGWAVDRQIRDLLPQLPADSVLRQLVETAHAEGKTGAEARFLHPAYEQSDPVARMLIEQIGEVLALGLSHAVHLLHPDTIVLGGGLSQVGEPFRAAVRQALPRFVMRAFQPPPVLMLSKLSEDAVPVGALLLAGLQPNQAQNQ